MINRLNIFLVCCIFVGCGSQGESVPAISLPTSLDPQERGETGRVIIVEQSGKFKEADWPGPKSAEQRVLPMRREEVALSRSIDLLIDPLTQPEPGAVVGALAGALLAAIDGREDPRGLVAAAVGGVAGTKAYFQFVKDRATSKEEYVEWIANYVDLISVRSRSSYYSLLIAHERSRGVRLEKLTNFSQSDVSTGFSDEILRIEFLRTRALELEQLIVSERELWRSHLQNDAELRNNDRIRDATRGINMLVADVRRLKRVLEEDNGDFESVAR